MIHEILPVGWLQCNCSVFGDREGGEAIVVDPGDETDRILGVLRKHSLTVKWIVITHAHIDHIGGAKKLKDATGAPVCMNESDLWLYRAMPQQAQMIGLPQAPETTEVDAALKDGDIVRVGAAQGTVLFTPGHTEGSSCLYFAEVPEQAGGLLFAGDTLFRDSIGRTDLPGGNSSAILRSIHTKLLALDDNTLVIPGHGPLTTIGRERAENPFLRGL